MDSIALSRGEQHRASPVRTLRDDRLRQRQGSRQRRAACGAEGKSEVRFESEVSLFHAVEIVLEREDATSVPVAEGVEHFSVDEDAEGNVWYGAHRRKVDEEGLFEFTLDEEDAEG
jgi:hypothetical protein